ncbi:BON domain-containing protein [Pseudidiomarina sp. YC-516-91]|uniref:BON domain-containing protein n=1 Tax=Pseudidiomarina salilacus TaxID=3384452 RepID=UPI00398521FA
MFTLNAKILVAVAVAVALGMSSVNAATKTEIQEAVQNARHETQIATTYALSRYLRGHDLSVTVVDGRALLSGYVAESVERDLAAAIASGVEGVTSVDNRIVVDSNYAMDKAPSSPRYADVVSDAEINAAIKSKLIWSKHADGMDLTVATTSGEVVLTGNVASQKMKQLTEKLARDTQGVRSVENQLVVSETAINGEKYGSPASKPKAEEGTVMADSWITTKVKSSLLYSRNVSGFDIGVNTEKGIVTLDGRVSSGAEKALAIELAEHVRGVKKVNANKLVF